MKEKQMYGSSLKGMRATLEETLVELGGENGRIAVIDCETGTATNILGFRDAFPDRFVTMGVAEQSGASFAFGASRCGLVPFLPLFSSFLTRRACDQIFIQIGYANANVKLVGCYTGMTSPNTGATHQSVNDIAIMRSTPGIDVFEAADPLELSQILRHMAYTEGPAYLRMIRGDVKAHDGIVCPQSYGFIRGKSTILRQGGDITLLSCGMMVSRCLKAAQALEEKGVSAEVLNVSSIKPLDVEGIAASAAKTCRVVVAENHSVISGLGSAVAEALSERHPVPMRFVGIKDIYGESGALEELFEKYGLTEGAIERAALELL